MKVYLAGPDVFLPDAREIGQQKINLCARYGHTGLFPLDNEIAPECDNLSLQIFLGNESMMDDANAIIANLTPFRGPSADAGTVYELGYMAGRGKLCLGYSNDPDLYADRVARVSKLQLGADNRMIEENGILVENFGEIDNLMIVHTLDTRGFPLVKPKTALTDIWHDLTSLKHACGCYRSTKLKIAHTGELSDRSRLCFP